MPNAPRTGRVRFIKNKPDQKRSGLPISGQTAVQRRRQVGLRRRVLSAHHAKTRESHFAEKKRSRESGPSLRQSRLQDPGPERSAYAVAGRGGVLPMRDIACVLPLAESAFGLSEGKVSSSLSNHSSVVQFLSTITTVSFSKVALLTLVV